MDWRHPALAGEGHPVVVVLFSAGPTDVVRDRFQKDRQARLVCRVGIVVSAAPKDGRRSNVAGSCWQVDDEVTGKKIVTVSLRPSSVVDQYVGERSCRVSDVGAPLERAKQASYQAVDGRGVVV